MKLIELIRACQIESGKKAKEELIKRFFSMTTDVTELFLLKCIVDPDITFNFSSQMIDKASEIHCEVFNNYSISEFLNALADGKLSGNNAIEVFNGLQLTKDESELLDIILRKTAVGFSLNSINKIYQKLFGCPFVEKFECQLANKYIPGKKYDTTHWWVTPKLDGLRAVFHADKGKLLTRSNKTFVGFEHIEEKLAEFCKKYNMKYVDGELYHHKTPFQRIQSIAVNEDALDPRKKELSYNVFAVVGYEAEVVDSADMNRFFFLSPLEHLEMWGHYITPLKPELIENNKEALFKRCKEFVDLGFEGIMLRHPKNFYHYGRSNDLLKLKFFAEDDFEIVGTFAGEGKYEGMLGGFILRNHKTEVLINPFESENFEIGTINSRCGSGFTDEQRANFGIYGWVGKIASIKYQGLTDDKSSLRFPIFLGIKEDR